MFLNKEFEVKKIKMLDLEAKNKHSFKIAIIVKQKIYSRWATHRVTP